VDASTNEADGIDEKDKRVDTGTVEVDEHIDQADGPTVDEAFANLAWSTRATGRSRMAGQARSVSSGR